ncbi:extracellular solute-binding protein [Streptomyces sp. SID13588]|uniref:extracellular solute-binding protein n=1 Tax=Streptomyces sp. SID13588 TaxID=2706051 RepID=UPI001EF2C316|nr:extracellular solute-binding protein [Streptomyces sp. SID13588]
MASTFPSRRRFLALSALTALSVPLATACGGDDSGDKPGADGKVTFAWWNIATTEPGKSLFPQISSAFTAAHPNITIKTTSLENEAFKSKLSATTSSGKLPDVFQTSASAVDGGSAGGGEQEGGVAGGQGAPGVARGLDGRCERCDLGCCQCGGGRW